MFLPSVPRRARRVAQQEQQNWQQVQSTELAPAEDLIRSQVPATRREEIKKYLELFGYKPDSTILQVHIAGYFNRRRQLKPKESESRQRAAQRYGGRTFTVVGTTHDPAIMNRVVKPRAKGESANQYSSGYVGYLFKKKDIDELPPHDLIPLDFVPSGFAYPNDWKNLFGTKGFLIAMHVPSSYAKEKKNATLRKIRSIGKSVGAKQEWMPFIDQLAREDRPSEQ